jgi:hypothetical protein
MIVKIMTMWTRARVGPLLLACFGAGLMSRSGVASSTMQVCLKSSQRLLRLNQHDDKFRVTSSSFESQALTNPNEMTTAQRREWPQRRSRILMSILLHRLHNASRHSLTLPRRQGTAHQIMQNPSSLIPYMHKLPPSHRRSLSSFPFLLGLTPSIFS